MRNFILFIRRFFNLILFITLEVVCLILITRTHAVQGVDLISSSNSMVGALYQKQNEVVYYFELKRMNDSLLNENKKLHEHIVQQQQWERVKDTIINRGFHASDTSVTLTYANFIYRTARVINNEVSNTDNYITINRGSEDGIKKNMAVISSSGAVGKVVSVSKHFSSVISVLSEKQPISAKLHDGTFGPVVWEIGKPDVLIMKDVSQEVKIRRGDSVMTTNFSFFPENILIGRVFKVELIKKNSMQRIYLHTAVNFRNLQYVYVVENTFLQEKMDLEEANK